MTETTASTSREIAVSSDVDDTAVLGPGTRVLPLAQVREGAHVGRECTIGRGAYIGPGVVLGDRCTVQDQAVVCESTVVEDGVLIGPAVVFTHDYLPRAVTAEGQLKETDGAAPGVTVREGASIGARAVCVAPVTIGRWAMVAAGTVVTRDVPDFALVAGVPARQLRWVGRAGAPLQHLGGELFRCPVTARLYLEQDGRLQEERVR